MEALPQLFINTLQIGSVYVLFALGLTLIFGVMRIINFAHAEFFTLAALVFAVTLRWAEKSLGWPLWADYLGAAAAAIVTAIVRPRRPGRWTE